MDYKFNPTAGVPMTSYRERDHNDPYKITWFSTVQPPKDLIKRASSPNKGKIMENDKTTGTVELVSSEVSGHLGPDGKFVYGEPQPATDPKPAEVYVQDGEDAIG